MGTFEQFVAAYGPADNPRWDEERLRDAANDPNRFEDTTLAGFAMRTRVPNGQGYFGLHAHGAQWCDPKDWCRLYYLARKAICPSHYPDSP